MGIRYFIIIIVSVSVIGCKNNGKRIIDDTFVYGKVKSISYSFYHLKESFGENQKIIESSRFTYFDLNTNLIKDSLIDNILETKETTNYKYDKNNNLIERTIIYYPNKDSHGLAFYKGEFVENMILISNKTKYEYDNNNYLIDEISIKRFKTNANTFLNESNQIKYVYSDSYRKRKNLINRNGVEVPAIISHFDENNRIIKLDYYDDAGNFLRKKNYGYDGAGNLLSLSDFDGIISRNSSFSYDTKNNLTGHWVSSGELNARYTYENFDKHGNWINQKIFALHVKGSNWFFIVYGSNWSDTKSSEHGIHFNERKIEYYDE